jgi:GT2 family glycosyltransferase
MTNSIETLAAPMPLVSVVILNYKRRDALARTLAAACAQDYPNYEIIVVDNNSQDGTPEFLQSEAPDVTLIELPENRGACGGRNAGIRAARGDIIITLDNDIYFESPLEVAKTAAVFEARPDIHVLAFQLCDPETGRLRDREWCHPKNWRDFAQTEFETNYFVEGACAVRRTVFDTCGGYYEPLYIGCEGYDLVLRIMDRGFRILYCPRIRLCHMMSQDTRTPERPYYFYTRNYIWIAYKDFPFFNGMKMLVPKLLMMLLFTFRSNRYAAFLRGLRDGLAGLRLVGRHRTPISTDTLRRYDELDRCRPALWVRLARHRKQPQL